MSAADAIISIFPDYADAILAGRKTIELRRRVPVLPLGMRLWIYATRPTGAVVGYVTVERVTRARPLTIWRHHSEGTGIDYGTFSAYFTGAKEAVAILLAAAKRVRPITEEVRVPVGTAKCRYSQAGRSQGCCYRIRTSRTRRKYETEETHASSVACCNQGNAGHGFPCAVE